MKPVAPVAVLSRRRFVKILTFGTATSLVAGKLWQREVLAYCDPLPGDLTATFKVRLSDYPALLQDFGSVRLGINPVRPDSEPFPDGNFWPLIINRDDAGNYYVLDSECRHASCVVPTYDPYEEPEGAMRCPCHGSLYNIAGDVIGGPAQNSLHAYPFTFDGNDTLTIQVTCWGFKTELTVLPAGSNSRVRLDFPTFPQVNYEVSFRETAIAAWTTVPFATTPNGATSQTVLAALGLPATVYLDRTTPSGFYAVGMKLSEV